MLRLDVPSYSHPVCWLAGVAIAVFLVAASAQASPMAGRYVSPDAGGDFLSGRYSEGFAATASWPLYDGAHAASWDAATSTLGGQWELSGPTISSSSLLNTISFGDTEIRYYYRAFDVTGATFVLKDTGPWWNGADPGTQYTVDITRYDQMLTVTLISGQIAEATSTDTFEGTFRDYPGHKVVAGHATGVYEGQGLSLPTNTTYPDWLVRAPYPEQGGSWGHVEAIRFTITPEPATLGLLGLGLAGLVWRRKGR